MAAKSVLQAHRHFLLRVTDDAVLVVNCSYQLAVTGSRSNLHLGNSATSALGPSRLGWRGYFGFCETSSVLRDFPNAFFSASLGLPSLAPQPPLERFCGDG